MANRKIDDLENANKGVNAVIAVGATIVAAVGVKTAKTAANNQAIGRLEAQRNSLVDEPLGKFRHRKKIKEIDEEIKKKRN